MSAHSNKIGFGGGCHWCTEAVFSSLKGTHCVQQGFIKSHSPHDDYSEAVLLNYDEDQISLVKLIEIHLRTHASTASHSMREKYRSAIYIANHSMAKICGAHLNSLQSKFQNPLVTQILEIVHFKSSPASYIDYYASDPDKPFCTTYIEPKLELLRRDFKPFLQR